MEHSKKFILIPEDRAQLMEHLSELDRQMKSILQNKQLTESDKASLYLQVLQKYTKIDKHSQENPPEPNFDQGSHLTENGNATQYLPTLKNDEKHEKPPPDELMMLQDVKKEDSLENKVMHAVPIRHRNTAIDMLQFLKGQNGLKWTDKGEIIYQDKVVPRTNIIILLNDFLRNRKTIPVGR